MRRTSHLPEYLMEAFGLALFMVSAGFFAVVLEHPDSTVRQAIADPFARRVLMGLAMGLTAVVNIYSPWGKRSGAHYNPATTLTFWRLCKVSGRDAVWYAVAQFLGAVFGALTVAVVMRSVYLDPPVQATATRPGSLGVAAAFLGEVSITFLLITAVLRLSNSKRLAPRTGLFVGLQIATFIALESPLSEMSMNPARTVGSAVVGDVWSSLWVYFVAPPLGMLLAAECHVWRVGRASVGCAKLYHDRSARCIFCDYQQSRARRVGPSSPGQFAAAA